MRYKPLEEIEICGGYGLSELARQYSGEAR